MRVIFSTNLLLSGLVFCLVAGCANTSSVPDSAKPDAPKASSPDSKVKSNKININTATNAELDKLELPGTKPSLSERIEGGRPYKQIDDLVAKKAISAEEFKLIQNLVTVETAK